MQFSVIVHGKEMEVIVTYKNIKNVRLKVFPDGSVKLSVPEGTPSDWIKEFLFQKQKWIENNIELFEETKAIEKEEHIRSGASTRILGKQMVIRVEVASQKRIICDDRLLLVFTPNPVNQADVDKQYNNWWQKSAKAFFSDMLDQLFPIVGKHGIAKPVIVVKKMKTLWGSCSRKHGNINLSFYLYKASRPCIEYVILHELAHFLYPRHNKDFYDFITIYMPDWKERKKQLDYEIVLGI